MNILAFGDIIGKPGRSALSEVLPELRSEFQADLVIVNGENSDNGSGITLKILEEYIHKLEIDVITMGNHWSSKREVFDFMNRYEQLILPGNMSNVPNHMKGLYIGTTRSGFRYAVTNLIGQAFMNDGNKSPFEMAENLLSYVPAAVRVRILDIHAETSSEKQALGHFLAGRVSLVYGTHTHTPTADCRIIRNHTGFVTDLGMTGPYDSVIGIEKDAAIRRFLTGEKRGWDTAKKGNEVHGIFVKVDHETGQCLAISRFHRILT